MIAYHFVGSTLRDGRSVPPNGEWLEHDGPVIMCESGLHASADPFDALRHAPGETLCMVELEGDVVTQGDKSVGRRRKIIKRFGAMAMLRLFARQRALSVIHLWDAPAIVREYLETGDESKRLDAERAAYVIYNAYIARSDAASTVWSAAARAARQSFNTLVAAEFEKATP